MLRKRVLLAINVSGECNNSYHKYQYLLIAGEIMGALDPYSGTWDEHHASHLLRRASFVTSRAKITEVSKMSIAAAVDMLLADKPAPAEPTDPGLSTTPWNVNLTTPHPEDFKYRPYIKDWWLNLLLQPNNVSAIEKLTLFWSNHFSTESDVINDSRFIYHLNALTRKYAMGNVRDMVKQITINTGMLRYLNGDSNTNNKPNENYARELQELFTIGKGKEIAPGDYTNYTEDDIKAAARVLTGWRTNRNGDPSKSVFQLATHDTKDKQFSKAYNNKVIKGTNTAAGGLDEMNQLVDMIFEQEETARYIIRKVYRWFVFYTIDDDTEKNVIQPLATMLRQNNFEIKPVLRTLFMSQVFFDTQNIAAMIKSPIDFLIGMANHFNFPLPTDTLQRVAALEKVWQLGAALQQNLMDPPSVAGWQAYYQEPTYYQQWINSVTLPTRYGLTDIIVAGGGGRYLPPGWGLDVLAYPETVSADVSNAMTLIADIGTDLMPAYTLTTEEVEYIAKNVLMGGGQVYEWTTIWNDYKANPTNNTKKRAAQDRLTAALKFMFRMAEYQLM